MEISIGAKLSVLICAMIIMTPLAQPDGGSIYLCNTKCYSEDNSWIMERLTQEPVLSSVSTMLSIQECAPCGHALGATLDKISNSSLLAKAWQGVQSQHEGMFN